METIDINCIYESWFLYNYEYVDGHIYLRGEDILVSELEVQEDFSYYLRENKLGAFEDESR